MTAMKELLHLLDFWNLLLKEQKILLSLCCGYLL
jgi:hypothetical protein